MATTVMRAVGRKIDGEFLGQIPIFGGLSEQFLEWIIAAGTIGHVPADVQVIAEGEPARSVFVVCEGELALATRTD